MNSIYRLFAKEDSDFMLLKEGQKYVLAQMVLLYLFRGCEERALSEMCKETLEWSGQETIQFRRNLIFNGHIQKNLKFYLYALYCGGEPKAIDYSIEKEDRLFVRRMYRRDKVFKGPLYRRIKKLSKQYPPRSLEVFEAKVHQMVEELDVYCKKFVWKKMRFLFDAASVKPRDLVNEVMQYGIYSCYKAYPEIKTYLHLLNIARTGIHNRGHNVIQEETAQSRSLYVTDENGENRASTLSIHAGLSPEMLFGGALDFNDGGHYVVCNNLMAGRDGSCVEGEPFSDCERASDLRSAVNSIKERLRGEAPREFLDLLMGNYHEGFSKYLRRELNIKGDNDDWWEEVSRFEYAEQARLYLDVPITTAKQFVRRLREELMPFVTN